jgi:hypothetical protein
MGDNSYPIELASGKGGSVSLIRGLAETNFLFRSGCLLGFYEAESAARDGRWAMSDDERCQIGNHEIGESSPIMSYPL